MFNPSSFIAAALCGITTLVVFGPSWALDFIPLEYRGQRALLLQGSFEWEDEKRFEQALQRVGPVEEVLFNSGGGSEVAGLGIGRSIRRHGLATRIPSKASCASACADAFLGGVSRRVEPGGRYGIHMPTAAAHPESVRRISKRIFEAAIDPATKSLNIDKVRTIIQDIEKASAHMASRWAAFVLEMGASTRLVDAGTRIEAGNMKWLTRHELTDFNVVNADN